MKKKRTVETRIELHEVWIITEPQGTSPMYCPVCADQQTAMLAPEAAATLGGLSLRNLFRLVEAGQLHFAEQANGTLLVCPNSLPVNPKAITLHRLLPSA